MTDDRTTPEHDRTVLACALHSADTARELLSVVDSTMFQDASMARAWSALRRVLAGADGPVDLADALSRELGGDGGDAPSLVDLHSLPVVPSVANASYYGAKLREAYARRELTRIAGADLLERGADLPTADLVVALRSRVDRLAGMVGGPGSSAKLLPEALTGDGWNVDPPARRWLVDGWLPAGELCLLAGPGSAGKGLLSLQLGAALACDRDPLQKGGGWLPVGAAIRAEAPALCADPCTVILGGWEDDRAELLRRRHRLSMYGGCEWARCPSINGRLHALPMSTPIWEARHDSAALTTGGLTPSGAELFAYAERIGAGLLVVDPIGLALSMPENDRPAVSLALGELRRWAQRTGTTVLLVGHPAKATDGPVVRLQRQSTAWLGSVRALMTLRAPDAKGDGAVDRDGPAYKALCGPDGYERVALLRRQKSNYGPAGDAVTVATRGGGAGWYLTDPIPPPTPTKRTAGATMNGTAPVGKVPGVS